MKEKIKKILFQTTKGRLFFLKLRVIREKLSLSSKSDYEYIVTAYRKSFGREVNFAAPQTYTEKLNWMKLFYRHEDMPVCSDKYEVREYIKSKGLGHLLNELIGVYTNANDIDFAAMPDKFVAKASHGSSWNLICEDKEALDWTTWRKIMNSWLKLNLYVFGREWNYKEMTPRIVVEKFIEQDPLIDYKFMCFNGEPKYIQINNDLEDVHYVDFYTINWEKCDFTYKMYTQSKHVLEKPAQLNEMIELASFLSKDFPYVRVDFYNVDGEIIFGEMTFFPGGGLLPLEPIANNFDSILGHQMQLPTPNHNLDMLDKIMNKNKVN